MYDRVKMRVGRPQFWGCVIGAFLGAASPVICKEAKVSPQLNEALQELRASASVWRDNDTEFRSTRRSGKLPGEEVAQFAEFVAELKRQVLENCQAVRKLGGENFLEPFDCKLPKEPARPLATLPTGPEKYKTEAEEVRSLDDELRKIEGEIDVFVRNKTQNSKRVENYQYGGAGAPSGNGYLSATDRKGGGRNNAGRKNSSGTNSSGETNESRKATEKRSAAANGVDGERAITPNRPGGAKGSPRNIDPGAGPGVERKGKRVVVQQGKVESGDDDDVLAAQLREAAEKETDSVLKEKLWAEYRKYKASKR